jgi:hypothetical protein
MCGGRCDRNGAPIDVLPDLLRAWRALDGYILSRPGNSRVNIEAALAKLGLTTRAEIEAAVQAMADARKDDADG